MTFELFQQGPAAYIPVLVLSLIMTVVAYGAFPFVFAKARKSPITKKKYRGLCYGINAAVMFLFFVLNGGASNGAPYFLWTWVFSSWGTRILEDKGLLNDGTYTPGTPARVTEPDKPVMEAGRVRFCRRCGEKLIDSSKFCRKCGTEVVEV